MYQPISQCRLCASKNLSKILDLGFQALTGIFPKNMEESVPAGPLVLNKCNTCDLVQLGHNYELSNLYGNTYGYRSGLNQSMVSHLHRKVQKILRQVWLHPGDMIVDIGSNDSTLLQAYPKDGITLVGVDPSGLKFKKYYPEHIELIPDFYSYQLVMNRFPGRAAKVITSIAMFYDLERPMDFVNDVVNLLDQHGVWVFEQSYLPFMLQTNSYDTVCHEHIEYYALKQIKYMTDRADLKIIDVEFNDVNGGSFSITAAKRSSRHTEATQQIERVLQEEEGIGLAGLQIYEDFRVRIELHRDKLKKLLANLKQKGKKILGYGASTKGNVLIQYCGLTSADVPFIAEVNEDKFGAYTPGSRIPIISEREARAMQPDYFIVFPWHFRKNVVERESLFLASGGKLIFPLPQIEIVSRDGSEML